jgi:hypothetical protein
MDDINCQEQTALQARRDGITSFILKCSNLVIAQIAHVGMAVW